MGLKDAGTEPARQHPSFGAGGQEPVASLEALDEMAGDTSNDNEWLYAAAADPALYLKDL